jgi:chlorophyll synthase
LLLFAWNRPSHAIVLLLLMLMQQLMLPTFLRDPVGKALWYSGFGVPFSVLGMMVCAHAVRSMGVAA